MPSCPSQIVPRGLTGHTSPNITQQNTQPEQVQVPRYTTSSSEERMLMYALQDFFLEIWDITITLSGRYLHGLVRCTPTRKETLYLLFHSMPPACQTAACWVLKCIYNATSMVSRQSDIILTYYFSFHLPLGLFYLSRLGLGKLGPMSLLLIIYCCSFSCWFIWCIWSIWFIWSIWSIWLLTKRDGFLLPYSNLDSRRSTIGSVVHRGECLLWLTEEIRPIENNNNQGDWHR